MMLNAAMTSASLKIAYALVTIGVAICVYVIGEHGGEPTWLTRAYFVATIVFAALIARLTFKAVDPKAPLDRAGPCRCASFLGAGRFGRQQADGH